MNVSFIIYIVANGKITKTGSCEEKHLPKQIPPEMKLIIGKALIGVHKIVDGKVVRKTAEEIAAEQSIPIPFEQCEAFISNEMWQDVLNRLSKLETET